MFISICVGSIFFVKNYPEYRFKPITIGHGCVKLEKMEMEVDHTRLFIWTSNLLFKTIDPLFQGQNLSVNVLVN